MNRKNLAPFDEGMGRAESHPFDYRRVELNENFLPFPDVKVKKEALFFRREKGFFMKKIDPELYFPEADMLINIPDLGLVHVCMIAQSRRDFAKGDYYFIPQDESMNYQVTQEDFDPDLYKLKTEIMNHIDLFVPNGKLLEISTCAVYRDGKMDDDITARNSHRHITEGEKELLSRLRVVLEFPNGQRYVSLMEEGNLDSFHPLDTPPFASNNRQEQGKPILLFAGNQERISEIQDIKAKFILLPLKREEE